MKTLMKNQYFKYFLFLLVLTLPSVILAQSFSLEDSTFSGFVGEVIDILNILRPILFGLAFIVFFWGLSKFILNSDSKVEVENGKKYMLGGVVALFVLVTFMAIIGFIANDLGFDNDNNPTVPRLNTGTTN